MEDIIDSDAIIVMTIVGLLELLISFDVMYWT